MFLFMCLRAVLSLITSLGISADRNFSLAKVAGHGERGLDSLVILGLEIA